MAMIFTVAIDGPAASGKGTIGRAIAARFGFAHLDTGLIYRAVGMKALFAGRGVIEPASAAKVAQGLVEKDLARDDLRTSRAANAASRVAAIPEVRAALVAFQRGFARREGGAVLDGRDIGTVICPEAEVKLFVTASDEVRAARRHAELVAAGGSQTAEQVLAELRMRDARDAGRETAPLARAPEAVLLDTTAMGIEEAVEAAARAVQAALAVR